MYRSQGSRLLAILAARKNNNSQSGLNASNVEQERHLKIKEKTDQKNVKPPTGDIRHRPQDHLNSSDLVHQGKQQRKQVNNSNRKLFTQSQTLLLNREQKKVSKDRSQGRRPLDEIAVRNKTNSQSGLNAANAKQKLHLKIKEKNDDGNVKSPTVHARPQTHVTSSELIHQELQEESQVNNSNQKLLKQSRKELLTPERKKSIKDQSQDQRPLDGIAVRNKNNSQSGLNAANAKQKLHLKIKEKKDDGNVKSPTVHVRPQTHVTSSELIHREMQEESQVNNSNRTLLKQSQKKLLNPERKKSIKDQSQDQRLLDGTAVRNKTNSQSGLNAANAKQELHLKIKEKKDDGNVKSPTVHVRPQAHVTSSEVFHQEMQEESQAYNSDQEFSPSEMLLLNSDWLESIKRRKDLSAESVRSDRSRESLSRLVSSSPLSSASMVFTPPALHFPLHHPKTATPKQNPADKVKLWLFRDSNTLDGALPTASNEGDQQSKQPSPSQQQASYTCEKLDPTAALSTVRNEGDQQSKQPSPSQQQASYTCEKLDPTAALSTVRNEGDQQSKQPSPSQQQASYTCEKLDPTAALSTVRNEGDQQLKQPLPSQQKTKNTFEQPVPTGNPSSPDENAFKLYSEEITPEGHVPEIGNVQLKRKHESKNFPTTSQGLKFKKQLFELGVSQISDDVIIIPLEGESDTVNASVIQEENLDISELIEEETLVTTELNEVENAATLIQEGNLVSAEIVDENLQAVNLVLDDTVIIEEIVDEQDNANEENNAEEVAKGVKRKRNNVVSDKPQTKKRKVCPSDWKANKAKLAHNSGVPHVSLRGQQKPGRAVKAGCSEKCRRKCHFSFSHESRQALFEKYWSLQDKMLQWYFLLKLTATVGVAQRKVVVDGDDEYFRNSTYQYFLPDSNSNRVQVCQKFFVDTFDISVRVVRTAIHKNSPDKRGKHAHHKRLNENLVEGVKSHIKSFPMVDSHYCRADTTRKYLDEHLSVAKMHRLYLLGRDLKDPETASLRQYRDIFNTYFNLSFFKPKKDQCSLCAAWKSSPENADKYQQHQDSKNFVRGLKKQDKTVSRDKSQGTNIRVLTCDLEKVLYCPHSEVGEFFYRRKLSVYNFTVYDCTVKEGHLYVWDQTIAKRGSDETSTCMQQYIESIVSSKGVDTIIIYSDSCSGQNKNQFLYTMYHTLAIKLKITIIHRYLEKGHTQMECDSVHARVEKKIRKQEIFLPAEYYAYMRTAKVKKPPYQVHELKQSDIHNYRDLASHLNWDKIPTSKVREITFSPNAGAGVIKYKLHWTQPEKEVSILIRGVGRPIKWETVKPSLSYNARIPLKPLLRRDLNWYVQKGYIPQQYVAKYKEWTDLRPGLENNVDQTEEEEENDLPTEIVPEANVVQNLLETEYEGAEFEQANPFHREDGDKEVDEDERSVYNDSDADSDSDFE